MPLSQDAALWGLRLLIGIDSPDDAAIEFHRNGYERLDDMRVAFMRTPEGRRLFEEANQQRLSDGRTKPYTIPAFLLDRPQYPEIEWRFEEPTLADTVSQLCTDTQMDTDRHREICQKLGLPGRVKHRKYWEFSYIVSALQQRGKLASGMRALGFGTGREPLPSLFAAAGVHVLATDAPQDLESRGAWEQTAQWTSMAEDLWHPSLIDKDAFLSHVTFQPVDMNAIPDSCRDYDFCWSACCLEHLGSIRHGLNFILSSVETLRPGGIAVHTTEFNLQSNTETFEQPYLCLFRRQDIELVIHELIDRGHHVAPLNLWPGTTNVDIHIDLPPFTERHLKLQLDDYVTTSIGLVITRASA